jgi:DNA sulfur modification protein DndD
MAKLTITQISIENLGPFRERQTLDLYGQSSRPVTLIKALNGSGKTTLLTALQIGLYGYKAINPGRRSEYDQLVAGLQRKDAHGNAVIEVTVDVELGANSQTLTVRREWMPRGTNLQEKFSVLNKGMIDLEFSETWDEFINGILPAELVKLFLFDGEKIEALANPDLLPDLLRRATEVFLGLGGIDALSNDLKAIERRGSNKKGDGFDEIRIQAEEFDSQLKQVEDEIAMLTQRQASALLALDKAQQKLEQFTVEAQRKGLNAYQQAAELKSQVKSTEEQHKQARANLANALEDPLLPLAWLGPFWHRYAEQWQQDRQAHHATLLIDEFAKRDRRILQALTNAVPEASQSIAELLEQDLAQFSANNQHTPILQPGADPTEIEPRLTQARSQLEKTLANVEQAAHALEKAQQSIGQIPAEEQLSEIFEELQTRTKAVSSAEAELHRLNKTLTENRASQLHLESRLNGAMQRLRTELKESALESKAMEASARAKKALAIFRERLLASKAHWLAEMITAEFKQLLRKRNLISQVLIDPTTYEVSIQDSNGHTLPMERLSAGERQLLAISVLSALIRERKGRFPVVVDTPLARLDRQHREALIHNFFAKISHQVLVLSTDEEVEGPVYEALQRHMGREYALTFDDAKHCSIASLKPVQTLAEATP